MAENECQRMATFRLLDTPENRSAATTKYLRSPELQKEFGRFETYYAYSRMEQAKLMNEEVYKLNSKQNRKHPE